MKNITRTFAGLAAFAILSTSAFAGPGVIAQFFADDVATDPATGFPLLQPPVWAHDPTVAVSNYTVHGGLTLQGGNAMTYVNWDTAMNPNKYVGFTVTPNAGVSMVLTSLAYDPSRIADGAAHNWAYRINSGAGYGPWTYEPTAIGSSNSVTWTFPTPIQTSGSVEFGFFTSAPTATSAGSPGSPILNGTAGDTSIDPSLHGSISQYTDASTFLIPQVSEASAITYDWDTKTFFCIGDEGPALYELDKTGNTVSVMTMKELKFGGPEKLKGDPEALSYLGKGSDGLAKVMIGAERQNVAIQTTYRPNAAESPDWMTITPTVTFGPTNGNIGLEGVSTDVTDGSLWGIKEREPISILHAMNPGTVNQTLVNIDVNELTWRFGIVSLSDIFVMANSAAYAGSDHILVLARDDKKIIEITKTGKVVDSLSIANLGRNTVEGMTMDDDGVIYLCSEAATTTGGDARIYIPGMHVLRKTRHPMLGTGGRQVLNGTAGDDMIYGNPAADTLTGGPGVDSFVFKSLRDGIDTITDFLPGVDVLDLTAVLASIGYKGTTYTFAPLTDGTVRVIDSPSGAIVQILSAGSYRSLALLPGLTAAQAGVASNFRFITTTLH